MSEIVEDTSMWIAPCRYAADTQNPKWYWTVNDWKALDLDTPEGWITAVEIFEDRLKYRYLDAIEAMQENDNQHYWQYKQRRFGFSMMALDCLLIETLAQFYQGIPESPTGRGENRKFYISFLCQDSFTLKQYFDSEAKANAFYETIRNGILHQAETKEASKIRYFDDQDFSNDPFDLLADGKSLKIHWSNFHPLVKDEFEAYCTHLRANDMPGLREKFINKMDAICRLPNGILAYGSLLKSPGNALKNAIESQKPSVLTPFSVEYARCSRTRSGAPTLVPVPEGIGAQVAGAILILKPDIDEKEAKDLLFRREKHKESDKSLIYDDAAQRGKNDALVIETLRHFEGFGQVYYTALKENFTEIIDPNLPPETKAELLARAAVDSVTADTFNAGLDGIRYLSDNLRAGIETPLSRPYEAAILDLAGDASDLTEARLRIARQKGILP